LIDQPITFISPLFVVNTKGYSEIAKLLGGKHLH